MILTSKVGVVTIRSPFFTLHFISHSPFCCSPDVLASRSPLSALSRSTLHYLLFYYHTLPSPLSRLLALSPFKYAYMPRTKEGAGGNISPKSWRLCCSIKAAVTKTAARPYLTKTAVTRTAAKTVTRSSSCSTHIHISTCMIRRAGP